MSRKTASMLFLGFCAWLVLAWVNLFCFSLPWADTWCYLGPAAAHPRAFHTEAPLLGNFLGSDHVWGLHFPGPPMIYSLVLAALGSSPAIGVLMFVAMWAALAALVGYLAYSSTRERIWGIAAAAVVLFDRCLFLVSQAARPELLAAIVVVVLWMALADVAPFNRRARLVVIGFCQFLNPVLHPITLAIGAAVCLVLLAQRLRRLESKSGPALAALLGYAAGCLSLFLWFKSQPEAWLQFRDHANSRSFPYSFGGNFWMALQSDYAPAYSGHLLWIGALLISLGAALRWMRKPMDVGPVCLWGAVIVLSSLVAQQKFRNECYIGVALPAAVVLVLLWLQRIRQRYSATRLGLWFCFSLVFLIAVHGSFWGARTLRYVQAGRPNLRREIDRITQELPASRKALIPEVLWESALSNQERFGMNTLPQSASVEQRTKYEAIAYRELKAGDLVVVDRFQQHQPLQGLARSEWTEVGRFTRILAGRKQWGYDLTVFRRN